MIQIFRWHLAVCSGPHWGSLQQALTHSSLEQGRARLLLDFRVMGPAIVNTTEDECKQQVSTVAIC